MLTTTHNGFGIASGRCIFGGFGIAGCLVMRDALGVWASLGNVQFVME